jgi:NAD(P)-dependent dehydrogenase (short-subunit alcohol dehydrogenase family)
MRHVAQLALPLHAIISNVAMGKVVRELADLKKASLDLSLQYTAWPVVELVQAALEILGALPRYVIAVTSDGPRVCHAGYDLVGASKGLLETLCRYLAVRLKPRGVRVNTVQPGALDTDSTLATFGAEAVAQVRARVGDVWIPPERVGRVVLALCSGLMDAVTGQTIVVDEGWSLVSPLTFVTGRAEPFVFPEDDPEGNAS